MEQPEIHKLAQKLTGAKVVEPHIGGGVFLDGTFYGIPHGLTDTAIRVRLNEIANEHKNQSGLGPGCP